MSPNHRSAESKISVDRKRPIQGLLRLHSRYGPPGRSATLRRPLSRGSNPCSCPHEPLVSYRINRQLSGWNPPPLMMRAFRAHCHNQTHAPQQTPVSFTRSPRQRRQTACACAAHRVLLGHEVWLAGTDAIDAEPSQTIKYPRFNSLKSVVVRVVSADAQHLLSSLLRVHSFAIPRLSRRPQPIGLN